MRYFYLINRGFFFNFGNVYSNKKNKVIKINTFIFLIIKRNKRKILKILINPNKLKTINIILKNVIIINDFYTNIVLKVYLLNSKI